jgi:hypothetical protein
MRSMAAPSTVTLRLLPDEGIALSGVDDTAFIAGGLLLPACGPGEFILDEW